MNIRHFFDGTVVSKEFFTKETMESELVKVPFQEMKGIELLGNIGNDNFFYIKKDDLGFFNSIKKITSSVHNWSAEILNEMQIFLLSRTGAFHIRTRSSGGKVLVGHNFKGSFEARVINSNSILIVGDDVTTHGARYQMHGDGIYIGRRCLFSE